MSLPPHILRRLGDRARAFHLLENPQDYPGLIPRPCSQILLRIWRYPSFEPHCSWAIIDCKEGLFLRRVVWDQTRDFAYGSETLFAKEAYDQLAKGLEKIVVAPFVADKRLGLDGTGYGVERLQFAANARLSWWETPPEGWTDLLPWHQQAAELFDSVLPMPTVAINYQQMR